MSGWVAHALTTVAFCWRIERVDGVTLGFTSHDRDILRDGVLHRAAPGMTPSAVRLSDGFDVDTVDVAGALTSAAIRDVDLETGRYDGAGVRLFAVDWSDDAAEAIPLMRGTLGEVAVRDGAFTAELSGPTAILARAVVEETSPDCRAELGDRRCRVDMAGRVRVARVAAVDETGVTIDGAAPEDDAYALGRARWVGGPNSGLSSPIARSAGAVLTLREMPPYAIAPGTLVEVTQGCDRTIATCSRRFGNAANFRGEPYLPGNDLLTRYPGA